MEQLSLLPADTLASLSALPGSERAREMTATSGRSCSELLRLRGPAGVCLKMLLDTSRWASTLCYLTWIPSATPQGRSLFRLVPSTPDTDEIGSGLWPTARANKVNVNNESALRRVEKTGYHGNLEEAVALWPTPTANEDACGQPSGNMQKMLGNHPALGKTKGSGSLNPAWVEWLMGYPLGWTDCADSETPSSRKSRRKSSGP